MDVMKRWGFLGAIAALACAKPLAAKLVDQPTSGIAYLAELGEPERTRRLLERRGPLLRRLGDE